MSEQELEIIQGVISAVVFQNYDNGYAVLRLAAQNGQGITVVNHSAACGGGAADGHREMEQSSELRPAV